MKVMPIYYKKLTDFFEEGCIFGYLTNKKEPHWKNFLHSPGVALFVL